ncbi:hypothetical protein HPB51_010737 [Rhipicephalus microplus]|uniref:Uncharacterized protein n=1 Tax=Rhipicephalus microplus TaxID=6941 RepID=A0A9J6DTW4_RHIMP|nr:hypothetical protein HPB51_010737 [Rhipicephalus microplus]
MEEKRKCLVPSAAHVHILCYQLAPTLNHTFLEHSSPDFAKFEALSNDGNRAADERQPKALSRHAKFPPNHTNIRVPARGTVPQLLAPGSRFGRPGADPLVALCLGASDPRRSDSPSGSIETEQLFGAASPRVGETCRERFRRAPTEGAAAGEAPATCLCSPGVASGGREAGRGIISRRRPPLSVVASSSTAAAIGRRTLPAWRLRRRRRGSPASSGSRAPDAGIRCA